MPGASSLRIGTRGSALARIQTELVTSALSSDRPIELVVIETEGDDPTLPLATVGRPGLFVGALRTALTANDVDVIVHSFKDLPTAPLDGVILAAVPHRADPHDALVSRGGLTLSELPAGSIVGTSSPRRAARVKHLRPDVDVQPIRGNVDTRLRMVADGRFDAAVLAVAGLQRLGRADAISEILTIDAMVPAPAQGALAVECRADDTDVRRMLHELNHPESRVCALAERSVLAGLAAGCATAVGAFAELRNGRLELVAELSDSTRDEHERCALGISISDSSSTEPEKSAERLGFRVAETLAKSPIAERIAR